MCDTLCVVGPDRTLFAKNSDRPPAEPQVVEWHPPRPAGGTLRTQYLDLPDEGAHAVLGSRPDWLWGFEHGVNEHRVAIGNEKLFTAQDAGAAPDALIGMDLVRLGLERAATAKEAVEVMTGLLERHGQGGVADAAHGEAYFSSFLVADPTSAWVVETTGSQWEAQELDGGGSISNRTTLRDDWRDPASPTDHADMRLDVTGACVAARPDPAAVLRTLRDHSTPVSVCMHLPGYMATTASMVADLTAGRVWVALGSPCRSVYVPLEVGGPVPAALGEVATWRRFAALADRPEGEVRAVLGPVEDALWADPHDPWPPVEEALATLGV